MSGYRATRSYRSNTYAVSEGDHVDVDDKLAAWVNRDSPGTLVSLDAPDDTATEALVSDEVTEDDAPDDTEAKPASKRGRNRAGA